MCQHNSALLRKDPCLLRLLLYLLPHCFMLHLFQYWLGYKAKLNLQGSKVYCKVASVSKFKLSKTLKQLRESSFIYWPTNVTFHKKMITVTPHTVLWTSFFVFLSRFLVFSWLTTLSYLHKICIVEWVYGNMWRIRKDVSGNGRDIYVVQLSKFSGEIPPLSC